MEDDCGLGNLFKKRLERMACEVELARDGHEGLCMFAKGNYDVVIADYNMPLVNGLEVLRKLNSIIPVIILTGQGDERVAVDAMKLGAADYMIKDIQGEYLEILPSVIDRVLERQQLIEDRRQARDELKVSMDHYQAIVEDQTELICRFELGGKMIFANEVFCHYFGLQQADIVFHSFAAILSKKAYQEMQEILKMLTPKNPSAMSTHNVKMLNGEIHWLQWTNRAIFTNAGEIKEYQLVGRDITELKWAEAALRKSEKKNSALLSAIPDTILLIDQYGNCKDLRVNPGQALNLSADCIGKNIADFFPADCVEVMREHLDKVFAEEISQIFQFTVKQGEDSSDQEVRQVFVGENEVLIILRDVTEHNKFQQQLEFISNHDSLTGLYNRTYFDEEMRRLESGRYHPVGIVVCDIDSLKIVNDNLGHKMGDELLKIASSLIRQAFRGNDAVVRIGGDEFVILLPNFSHGMIVEVCNRFKKMVDGYNEAKTGLFVSISVGHAVNNDPGSNLSETFKQADREMYKDKLSKRETVKRIMVETIEHLRI